MNKVVFFRYLPLTQKVTEDFYFRELVSYGYEVEYWDITSLFFSDQSGLEHYNPSNIDGITVKYIQSKKELKYLIRNNNSALIISLMTFEWRLIYIFRYFKRYNCTTSVFSYYPLPLHVGNGSLIEKAYNIKRLYRGIMNRIFIPLLLNIGYIKLYDFVFKGGQFGWKGIGNVKLDYLKKTRFFEVNNWDYDRFINSKLEVTKESFIVFLDEYYPFHPDALMLGNGTVEASKYFSDMNKVFSVIEKFYNMPVVIAAHPKALKYRDHNYFDGRKVCFNKTMDLVSKASLVVAHDSLSIGYAIMCNKDIVFICSNEIKTKLPHNYETINGLSKFFQSPLLDADDPITDYLDEKLELTIEKKTIYDGIRKGYMSLLDEPKSNSDLIKIYFDEIFKKLEYDNFKNM